MWLETEPRKGHVQQRNVRQMFADLAVLGYRGSCDQTAAFTRQQRETAQISGECQRPAP